MNKYFIVVNRDYCVVYSYDNPAAPMSFPMQYSYNEKYNEIPLYLSYDFEVDDLGISTLVTKNRINWHYIFDEETVVFGNPYSLEESLFIFMSDLFTKLIKDVDCEVTFLIGPSFYAQNQTYTEKKLNSLFSNVFKKFKSKSAFQNSIVFNAVMDLRNLFGAVFESISFHYNLNDLFYLDNDNFAFYRGSLADDKKTHACDENSGQWFLIVFNTLTELANLTYSKYEEKNVKPNDCFVRGICNTILEETYNDNIKTTISFNYCDVLISFSPDELQKTRMSILNEFNAAMPNYEVGIKTKMINYISDDDVKNFSQKVFKLLKFKKNHSSLLSKEKIYSYIFNYVYLVKKYNSLQFVQKIDNVRKSLQLLTHSAYNFGKLDGQLYYYYLESVLPKKYRENVYEELGVKGDPKRICLIDGFLEWADMKW